MCGIEMSPQVDDEQVEDPYGSEQFSLRDVEFYHRQE
jgi:hypothetical protein